MGTDIYNVARRLLPFFLVASGLQTIQFLFKRENIAAATKIGKQKVVAEFLRILSTLFSRRICTTSASVTLQTIPADFGHNVAIHNRQEIDDRKQSQIVLASE
jgi:hypothetical protein